MFIEDIALKMPCWMALGTRIPFFFSLIIQCFMYEHKYDQVKQFHTFKRVFYVWLFNLKGNSVVLPAHLLLYMWLVSLNSFYFFHINMFWLLQLLKFDMGKVSP